MAQRKSRSPNSEIVSATDVSSFVYCPEQWRLSVLGNPSENLASLERGERFHEKTAAVEVTSRAASRLGLVLLGVAALLMLVFLLWRR